MRVLRQCTVPRGEVMFITIQLKITRLSQLLQTARCLQLGYESLRLLIANQSEVFRPPACFVLPPHCTKDVYTPQGSTRDLWTVHPTSSSVKMETIRSTKTSLRRLPTNDTMSRCRRPPAIQRSTSEGAKYTASYR
jgi:hypothetical protein